MKKTIFSLLSVIAIYCGNISNVNAVDFDLSEYNKRAKEYQQIRDQYALQLEETCDSVEKDKNGGITYYPNQQKLPEYNAIWAKLNKLDEEFSQYNSTFKSTFISGLIHELIRSSRNPLPKEFEGVHELIALVQSRGIKVDGVRFMDAISLANYLTDSKIKSEIIPMLFLANKRACTNFIQTHFNQSSFSSESFKSKVQKTVEQGCIRSKLFRDLFVTTFGTISSGSFRVFSQALVLSGGGRTF